MFRPNSIPRPANVFQPPFGRGVPSPSLQVEGQIPLGVSVRFGVDEPPAGGGRPDALIRDASGSVPMALG